LPQTDTKNTNSISGRYEGERTAPKSGGSFLDLRIDVDVRYPNSPVLKKVSGDFFQSNTVNVPGTPPKIARTYKESWIVNEPKVKKANNKVEITGKVIFWKGKHPDSTLKITMTTPQPSVTPTCVVTFSRPGGQPTVYNCTKKSDAFRTLNLEIDVCKSVNTPPVLPECNTDGHPNKPAGLPARVLTIEEAYREAGVQIHVRPGISEVDDSDPAFETWSDAELHNAMETYFSQIGGPWPKWEMWGLLAGTYESDTTAGLMFDSNAGAFDGAGAGKAPERQGFAVFRKHFWFNDIVQGKPSTPDQAASMRQFLWAWVHEAGHAFNFLHSFDKNRPDALSWMNYDWQYDENHGPGSFWANFMFQFDDEELIHLRHGDRSAVIMGGDPWASGGTLAAPPGAEYLNAPPGAMASIEGEQAIEVLVRSKEYFEFMEPVAIELRLRNLFPDMPVTLDSRLNPEYGGVVIYIRRPDGRIVQYTPVMCKLAHTSPKQLQPLLPDQQPGPDRYSEEVLISYGRYGFYFDVPGEYYVRALYQGGGDLFIPSNVHRLRVGSPLTRDLDRTAQDYFSYEVGMNLYLDGSRSPHLEKGFDLLREMSEKHKKSLLGAKLAMTVANSLAQPFFHLTETGKDEKLKLSQTHMAEPKAALKVTEAAVDIFQKADQKALNLSYRQLVSQRVDCLMKLERQKQAVKELDELQDHLKSNGANAPVLDQIDSLKSSISTTAPHKVAEYHSRHRLWERVRTHDQLADMAGTGELAEAGQRKRSTRKSKSTTKSRKKTKKSRKRTKK
jgi:hypothetical protein